MDTVLLVSEQRMKQWTSLDNNIRIDVLTPSILNAQSVYSQQSLGTRFYNRLKSGIVNNDLTTNENNFLRDYVGPALMQYSLYLVLPSLKYKLVEKGIVSGTSEETAASTLEDMKYLRQNAMNLAQFYDERLREFLQDNPGMFPEYTNPGTDGMQPDRGEAYQNQLVTKIPKTRNENSLWIYADCGVDCDPDCSSCN
tara:strand:+ start:1792 stop:2382 length:591 start_codon:yes stop_codon:yes gene_type:complete